VDSAVAISFVASGEDGLSDRPTQPPERFP